MIAALVLAAVRAIGIDVLDAFACLCAAAIPVAVVWAFLRGWRS